MTEAEWLTSGDPAQMLDFLEGKATDRKFMLFSAACLRRAWDLLVDERSRRLLLTTERFVDGSATSEEACQAYDIFYDAYKNDELEDRTGGHIHGAVECSAHSGAAAAMQVAWKVADSLAYVATTPWRPTIPVGGTFPAELEQPHKKAWTAAERSERAAQRRLVDEIFGNPFRPASLDPGWLTPSVLQLAQTIYEEPRFEAVPELGRALEKAGCADPSVLDHCFEPGPHVRGCWVIDRILGKDNDKWST
jgi:hypothetical protein